MHNRVGEGHGLPDVVDPLPAHGAVDLVSAVADAAGETVPAVMGATQTIAYALISTDILALGFFEQIQVSVAGNQVSEPSGLRHPCKAHTNEYANQKIHYFH